ncbi:hypothetical protein NQ318_017889 [Aromia moschata]|uniref:Uncharacterized protein n=1 Tax=Aromia moschata TaxID=1265417 RepID=A0AAV8YAT7_9CUCU|nr:hypothetical protein NQ318_017889 [Aromia moschata]
MHLFSLEEKCVKKREINMTSHFYYKQSNTVNCISIVRKYELLEKVLIRMGTILNNIKFMIKHVPKKSTIIFNNRSIDLLYLFYIWWKI